MSVSLKGYMNGRPKLIISQKDGFSPKGVHLLKA